jgi:hypothetical protein
MEAAYSISPTCLVEAAPQVPHADLRAGSGASHTPSEGFCDRVVARIPIGRGPGAIAVGADAVWIANFRGRRPDLSVSRIDARSNRLVATIRLGRLVAGVAVGGGYAWVVNPGKLVPGGGLDMSGGTLVRIDPAHGTRHRPRLAGQLAAGADRVRARLALDRKPGERPRPAG